MVMNANTDTLRQQIDGDQAGRECGDGVRGGEERVGGRRGEDELRERRETKEQNRSGQEEKKLGAGPTRKHKESRKKQLVKGCR